MDNYEEQVDVLDEEIIVILNDDTDACSSIEVVYETQQHDSTNFEMDELQANETADEHLEVALPTDEEEPGEPSNQNTVINVRKRKRETTRKTKKHKIKAKGSKVVEYGSMNYPDDSDDERVNKMFFHDEPKLYSKLMKWNPETPAPRSLKDWRDALNAEFAANRYMTPLCRFYRIFLNRQLGDGNNETVRIQRFCSGASKLELTVSPEERMECATSAIPERPGSAVEF